MNERERLRWAIGAVASNASNFPEKVQARLLGQDMGPLMDKITDAVIAAGFRLQPEPEWEYAVKTWPGNGASNMTVVPDRSSGTSFADAWVNHLSPGSGYTATAVRRRKAGEWESVE